MAKEDYSKVEGILKEGLDKIEVEKLLEATDTKSGAILELRHFKQLVILIQYELKQLERHGFDGYKLFKINKKEFKNLIEDPYSISDEDKKKIIDLKSQIGAFKAEKKEILESDEDVVAKEREKHKKKKINVRKNWVPLK